MHISSKKALIEFLNDKTFPMALDVPSGNGWLGKTLPPETQVDGIDLFEEKPQGYRQFWQYDLDNGIPKECSGYDLICCCEGIEHVGNPLLLLRSFKDALIDQGTLIVTTPNIWYPQSRIQYLLRGFFPSFPSLVGDKIKFGQHMHITPWSYPQLYLYLKLAGFEPPSIIPEPLSKPKHFHERIVGLPSKIYCSQKVRKSKSKEERNFWETAKCDGSRLGRHLMVIAKKNKRSDSKDNCYES